MMAALTELEAVNDMLATIGQAPLNTFNSGILDQNMARAELGKVVREVCLYGFKFNTDENHVLTPNTDGICFLPAGAFSVDPMDPRQDLTVRKHPSGAFAIWDNANLTWTLAAPVKVRIKWSFDYDALPETARGYAVLAAGRRFQARLVGDRTLDAFAAESEQKAWLSLQREQSATADINMFSASPELAVKTNRRRGGSRFTR